LQFTGVRADEDAESILIARPGPGKENLLALAGHTVGHGWSA
jgi:hypothetical protein